ncbi:death-associated inhibitor of apoptosis 1 isoform X2 [Cylas formicarius]|uniref:death-associated inhibitor of apoptosis 1 isoform X2 n=1 Tax=Cylas formicarius TaxID=197179 RepID=UPI0029584059|nr:death-associated inhibitor of apoptosis 1 isoform X2 [Cylas formicarius]
MYFIQMFIYIGVHVTSTLKIMSELILSHTTRPLSTFRYPSETDNGAKRAPDSPEIQTETLDYKKYEDRIKSFVNWPNNQIAIDVLAKAGFYYKNHEDVVECPYCNIEGYQWVADDNPMEDHRTWSPNCPFVATSVEHDNSSNETTRTVDTCGLYGGLEVLPNSVPEDERRMVNLERLGIPKNKGLAHPEKFTYESRIKTFGLWPKSIKQTPHDLADAGFFYLGVGDQTLCFHCGGGLKDWEENDDPWEEHALWFPKCNYLLLKKGAEYVEQVKQKKHPKAGTSQPKEETKEKTEESSASKCESVSEAVQEADKTLCKICYKNELGVVFLPCRHIAACVDCSVALKNCVVCRAPLEATVRVFIS